MKRNERTTTAAVSSETALEMLGQLDETMARVNLAALGIAAPMMAARLGAARREAARAAADPAIGRDEVDARVALHARLEERSALFDTELARAQVTPQDPKDPANATLSGRVVDGSAPVARARLVAEVAGRRVANACADAAGRFAVEVPAGTDVLFSIARATGPVVHRERTAMRFTPGQAAYHDFDLSDADAPCEPPADGNPAPDPTPEGKTVPVPDVVGQKLEGAKAVLEKSRLQLGKVTQTPAARTRIGLVVTQSPKAQGRVPPGSAVDVAVGAARDPTTGATAPDVKATTGATRGRG